VRAHGNHPPLPEVSLFVNVPQPVLRKGKTKLFQPKYHEHPQEVSSSSFRVQMPEQHQTLYQGYFKTAIYEGQALLWSAVRLLSKQGTDRHIYRSFT